MSCTALLVAPIFLADHLFAVGKAAREQRLADGISVCNRQAPVALDQRRDGPARAQRRKQAVCVLGDIRAEIGVVATA
jgi:hypothetical protein